LPLLKEFQKKTHFDSNSLIPNEPEKDRPRRAPKGKTIPLQAWTGPDGSSRLRLPDFKTFGT